MKKPTLYETLFRKLNDAAESHPRSYVVINSSTHKIIGTGADPEKALLKAQKKLKNGEIPVISKKLPEKMILIL